MTDPAPASKKSLLIEDFPADLKHKAKVAAAIAGTTLRAWMIAGVTAAVDKAEKKRATPARG